MASNNVSRRAAGDAFQLLLVNSMPVDDLRTSKSHSPLHSSFTGCELSTQSYNCHRARCLQKPSYHAKVLETLEPYLQPGARVLEVGSGSGYLTACMALLVGESGKAVALDHILELIYATRKSVQQTPAQKLVDAGALSFVVGDGRAGAPEFAPYDVVVLLEYSPRITLPVYTQVKEGGVLLTYAINPGEIEFEQKLMRRRCTGEVDEVGRVVSPGDCVFEALQVVHVNQEGYSPLLTKAAQRGTGFAYR